MIPKLEMMFKDNKNSAQCLLTQKNHLSEEDLSRVRQLVQSRFTPHVEQSKQTECLWLQDIDVNHPLATSLFQFSKAVTPKPQEWSHYNAQLERFYEMHEQFVKQSREYENLKGRTAELELKLLNAGENIARDLLVKMTLPPGVILYSESNYPQKPVAPVPPEKPAPVYEKMLMGTLPIQKHENANNVINPDPSANIIYDLKICHKGGYDVSFKVKKIPQQQRLVVGKFFVVFPTLELAESFIINYEVYADQFRPVKTGQLSIKVLRAA